MKELINVSDFDFFAIHCDFFPEKQILSPTSFFDKPFRLIPVDLTFLISLIGLKALKDLVRSAVFDFDHVYSTYDALSTHRDFPLIFPNFDLFDVFFNSDFDSDFNIDHSLFIHFKRKTK